jgi:hypothetical protein
LRVRVEGLGLGFRISLGLRVQGSGFRVQGLGFRVQGNVLKSQNPWIYTVKYTWALTLENFYHQGVVVVDCAAGKHSQKSSILSFSTVISYCKCTRALTSENGMRRSRVCQGHKALEADIYANYFEFVNP